MPETLDAVRCDADFSIRADGIWLHEGTLIRREALAKLFSTILTREADGSYWLKTPAEQCRITVEDHPFLAAELQVSRLGQPEQELRFRTTLDHVVTVNAAHPIAFDDKGPYLPMEKNLSARISRPAYYELVQLAIKHGREENDLLHIQSCGTWFPLGKVT